MPGRQQACRRGTKLHQSSERGMVAADLRGGSWNFDPARSAGFDNDGWRESFRLRCQRRKGWSGVKG